MRISLNQMVELLSDMAGKPFDIPLQEELKVIFNYKRADYLQKIIDRHPEQRSYFLKDFSAELERVDKAECPVEVGCEILKTVYKVPIPIRTSYALFDYVGDPAKDDGYRYMAPEQIGIMSKYSKYTGGRPSYFYVNGYVYIYGDLNLEYINVRGVFSDPRALHDFTCNGQPCYTDNDQYDIPDDIINLMVQDTLKNELRLLMEIDKTEVVLDQTTKQ